MASKRKGGESVEAAGERRDQSRARARSPSGLRRERVWEIAQLMAGGLWERGKTDKELAERWDLAENTVEHMACEASRIVDLTTGQREALVRLARATLIRAMEESGIDRVNATRALLEHIGEMPKRVEMSGPAGGPIETTTTARVVLLPAKVPVPSALDDDEPSAD